MLVHFSAEPLTTLSKDWDYGRPPATDKPNGLWVSVEGDGDGWSDWCRAEEYDGLGDYAHEVTIRADARILRVTTPEGIDALTERYGIPGNANMCVDWPRIASEYQGILIAPYQWSRRLHGKSRWYYTWDCASGCVWDLDAVESVRPLASTEAS